MTTGVERVLVEPAGARPDPLALATAPGLSTAQVVTIRGWTVVVGEPLTTVTDPAELDALGRRCGWHAAPEDAPEDAPPFVGGAVGVLTDDCAPGFLDLPAAPWQAPTPLGGRPPPAPLPPMWFGLYDSAVCRGPDGQTLLVAADLPGLSRRPAAERLSELRAWVRAAAGPAPTAATPPPTRARPSLTPAAHDAAVRQALEWIAAGDLYQLNLTLQVRVDWPGSPEDLARRLWAASPEAAHAAFLRLPGDTAVVSISPETFLRTDGAVVQARPLKGTRARGADPGADRAAAEQLLASPKDRAEHVMIVDLERNDLGRVCTVGSVRVPELIALEEHPTVWHLVSTVRGTLRAEIGLGELLAATFPCGSVTGAPKRAAVERTAALETVRRGAYCGAIGVISRGLVDLSVAIRTAVVHRGQAAYGTGGGIVADSEPRGEWDEAMDKARAFLRATNAELADADRPAASTTSRRGL